MSKGAYYLFAMLAFGLFCFVQFVGWKWTSYQKVANVPSAATLRSNPGSYRSHHGGSAFIFHK